MARVATPRIRAAAKRNIKKAQVSRIRTREPRQLGRLRPAWKRSAGTARGLRKR